MNPGYIAAALELAIGLGMLAMLIVAMFQLILDAREHGRLKRAYDAALQAPAYVAACEARRAAWDAVNASRINGRASAAAWDAYEQARRQAARLAPRY